MATERHASRGYLAIGKETTKGTAVTPTVYVPIYDSDLWTAMNYDMADPIVGNQGELFQINQGFRNHAGKVTFFGDPNMWGYFFNMIGVLGTETGTDPGTHPFTFPNGGSPKSYTVDVLTGVHGFRFRGVEAAELTGSFDENQLKGEASLVGLGSFITRNIASTTGTGPTAVTLTTNYDPSPTTGLVAGDILQFYDVSLGTYVNGTVASITDADTVSITQDWSSAAAGDIVTIRAASPSYSLKTTLQEARSEFRFGATAAAALTATHTGVQKGAGKWIMRNQAIEQHRTGSYDPASIARGRHGADIETKIIFDDPVNMDRYLSNPKRALVIRHYATGTATDTYELRLTFNNIRQTEDPVKVAKDDFVYEESKWRALYDITDTQTMDVTVINGITNI